MNNLKKTGGFTLVELIVVIAILGILAAVAVPAYSGYVKKANEAGDTQILSAVNTAIAAAVTENNLTMADAVNYLTVTAEAGSNGGCSVEVTSGSSDTTGAVLADFTTYFGDDEFTFAYYVDAEIGTNGNLSVTDPS